ncbi:unnamed protein product [Pelagomonas calceolata]|uniref:RING-type domain-containing protein n=2 Tax=Pelagomonas calceolata TaxID=35677 RepID=A0A8J2SZ42_9STRA|nr:unnamed protein product [Pelagomonas calceolata]
MENCPICLEDLDGASPVLPCGHRCHASCLGQLADANGWAATRRGTVIPCPSCRKESRVAAPTPVAAFGVGDEVYALWGHRWYPGVVDEVLEDGYEIAWDEEDASNEIPAARVRARVPVQPVPAPTNTPEPPAAPGTDASAALRTLALQAHAREQAAANSGSAPAPPAPVAAALPSKQKKNRPTAAVQQQRLQLTKTIFAASEGSLAQRRKTTQRLLEKELAKTGGNVRSKAWLLVDAIAPMRAGRETARPPNVKIFLRVTKRATLSFLTVSQDDVVLRLVFKSLARPSTRGIEKVRVIMGLGGVRSVATVRAFGAFLACNRAIVLAVNFGGLPNRPAEFWDAVLDALRGGGVAYVYVGRDDTSLDFTETVKAVTEATRRAQLQAWADAGGAPEDEPLWHREDEIARLCHLAGGGEDAAFGRPLPLGYLKAPQRAKQRRRASFGVCPWMPSPLHDLPE